MHEEVVVAYLDILTCTTRTFSFGQTKGAHESMFFVGLAIATLENMSQFLPVVAVETLEDIDALGVQ